MLIYTTRIRKRGQSELKSKWALSLFPPGLIPSMSRKGDCYDNAVAESFFSTLKNELLYGERFISREQAKSEIFKFMEIFYNRQRLHQSLNYVTPEMAESEVVF